MKNILFLRKNLFQYTIFAFGIFIVLFSQTITANAVSRTWDGGGATNNWSDAANWSGDVAPTSADDAVFNSTSTKAATIDQNFTVSTFQIQSGYTGTITQSAARISQSTVRFRRRREHFKAVTERLQSMEIRRFPAERLRAARV